MQYSPLIVAQVVLKKSIVYNMLYKCSCYTLCTVDIGCALCTAVDTAHLLARQFDRL